MFFALDLFLRNSVFAFLLNLQEYRTVSTTFFGSDTVETLFIDSAASPDAVLNIIMDRPNVRFLSLAGNDALTDTHIGLIVSLLPRLKFLDLERCYSLQRMPDFESVSVTGCWRMLNGRDDMSLEKKVELCVHAIFASSMEDGKEYVRSFFGWFRYDGWYIWLHIVCRLIHQQHHLRDLHFHHVKPFGDDTLSIICVHLKKAPSFWIICNSDETFCGWRSCHGSCVGLPLPRPAPWDIHSRIGVGYGLIFNRNGF